MTEECFLCLKKFEKGDEIVEFFGGHTHSSCLDDKMKENAIAKVKKSMVKVKPNYPCNSCELRGDIECPLDQGFECYKLKKWRKKNE